MTDPEAAVREELRQAGGELERLRRRFQLVLDGLPVSARADLMLLGEEDADFATEARRTLECLLCDHLDPLIEALRATADYAMPAAEAKASPVVTEGAC